MKSWLSNNSGRLIAALVFILPLIWISRLALYPLGFPLPVRWFGSGSISGENFARVLEIMPIGRYTLNSLVVAALAVPLSLVTGSLTAFGISRLARKSQGPWVLALLALLMVPDIALWAPRFLVYKYLGWLDSYWALIAPAWIGTSPFFILMFYRAFRRIPEEMFMSARIDGAGLLNTWGRIALPVARPTAVGVGLLTFFVYWGDFTSPFLYLNSDRLFTLPVSLQLLLQLAPSNWQLLMAGVCLTLAVPAALFLFAQPYFSKLESS